MDHATELDRVILQLLLRENRPIWTLDEIVREAGAEAAARDALRRLDRGGLIHYLTSDFVIASQTAHYREAVAEA